jgi:hypothetical protein
MTSPLVDLVFDVRGIGSAQFSVLIALCRFASKKDHACFVSLTDVAKAAHMSVRQVQRTLPSLIELKLVAVLAKGNGRGNGHKYQINATLLRSITKTSVSRKYLYGGGETMDETLNYDTVSSIRQPRSRTLRGRNDSLSLPDSTTSPLENPDKSNTTSEDLIRVRYADQGQPYRPPSLQRGTSLTSWLWCTRTLNPWLFYLL